MEGPPATILTRAGVGNVTAQSGGKRHPMPTARLHVSGLNIDIFLV